MADYNNKKSIVGKKSAIITTSSNIRQAMRRSLELTVSPSAELDTACCAAINQALDSNKKEILALADPLQTPTTKIISHHIKTTDPAIRYLDVLFDQTTQQYSILVKKSDHQKFEGFHKNVCTQFLISPSHSTQQQTITPVVSIKAKDNRKEDQVMSEVSQQEGIIFTCLSSNKSDAKRIQKKRGIQTFLGLRVIDQTTILGELPPKTQIKYIISFMLQVGTQIAYYNHIKRKTHFDCHYCNILALCINTPNNNQEYRFNVIDYPSSTPYHRNGIDTEPSRFFSHQDFKEDKVNGWFGVAIPFVGDLSQNFFGWSEFQEVLHFLDIPPQSIEKYNHAASNQQYKIQGFTADSFGYLLCLYCLIKNIPDMLVLFKPFCKKHLTDLLTTSHTMPKKHPEHLTPLGILENFITYCEAQEALQETLAEQIAQPAIEIWPKSLQTSAADQPTKAPSLQDHKPTQAQNLREYIDTLRTKNPQPASLYFHDILKQPSQQKNEALFQYMQQVSQQLTDLHNSQKSTHFHMGCNKVITHLEKSTPGQTIRKFTLLPPSHLTEKSLDSELAPQNMYSYDNVHDKADQQWGVSSPFIKPWPHMDGWHELQSLLSFIQVDTATAKKFGNISLTNEGEEYQTCGYAIDSYGYLYSLYTLIKDDPALSKAFRPFLQKQMLDVITTSHKRPKNWPKSLMPQGIMQQFTQYCLNHSIPIGQKATVTQKKSDPAKKSPITLSIPPERPATPTNKELLQQLKNGVSLNVKIGFLTLVYDFIMWLFTGKKTTLSLKKSLLSQLSELQKNNQTPSQRAKSAQTCLQIIQELDSRNPKLSLHTLPPLIHLKQQLSSHGSQKNHNKPVPQSKYTKLASQDIIPTQPICRTKSAPNPGRLKKKIEEKRGKFSSRRQ